MSDENAIEVTGTIVLCKSSGMDDWYTIERKKHASGASLLSLTRVYGIAWTTAKAIVTRRHRKHVR